MKNNRTWSLVTNYLFIFEYVWSNTNNQSTKVCAIQYKDKFDYVTDQVLKELTKRMEALVRGEKADHSRDYELFEDSWNLATAALNLLVSNIFL